MADAVNQVLLVGKGVGSTGLSEKRAEGVVGSAFGYTAEQLKRMTGYRPRAPARPG